MLECMLLRGGLGWANGCKSERGSAASDACTGFMPFSGSKSGSSFLRSSKFVGNTSSSSLSFSTPAPKHAFLVTFFLLPGFPPFFRLRSGVGLQVVCARRVEKGHGRGHVYSPSLCLPCSRTERRNTTLLSRCSATFALSVLGAVERPTVEEVFTLARALVSASICRRIGSASLSGCLLALLADPNSKCTTTEAS